MGKLTFGATGLSYQPKEVKLTTFGAPVCPRCNERVYFNEEKRAIGKVWHTKCFTCGQCKKRLDTSNAQGHEGEVYCVICHKKSFGPKGYGFAGGAAGLSTESSRLKPRPVQEGTKTQVPSSSIPANSFDTTDRNNCIKCGKKVYFAEEVKALKRKCHRLCFKCGGCNKMLEPGRFSEREDDVYCMACYGRKFGPKGYGFAGGAGSLLSSDMPMSERIGKRRKSMTDKFDANGRLIKGYDEASDEGSHDTGYASPANEPSSPTGTPGSPIGGPSSPVSGRPYSPEIEKQAPVPTRQMENNSRPAYMDSTHSKIYRAMPAVIQNNNEPKVQSPVENPNRKMYPAVSQSRTHEWVEERASPVDNLITGMNRTHLQEPERKEDDCKIQYLPPSAAIRDICDRASPIPSYSPVREPSPAPPQLQSHPGSQYGYQQRDQPYIPNNDYGYKSPDTVATYQDSRPQINDYQQGNHYQYGNDQAPLTPPPPPPTDITPTGLVYQHVRENSSGYESNDHVVSRDGSPETSPSYKSQSKGYAYPGPKEVPVYRQEEQRGSPMYRPCPTTSPPQGQYNPAGDNFNPAYRDMPYQAATQRNPEPYGYNRDLGYEQHNASFDSHHSSGYGGYHASPRGSLAQQGEYYTSPRSSMSQEYHSSPRNSLSQPKGYASPRGSLTQPDSYTSPRSSTAPPRDTSSPNTKAYVYREPHRYSNGGNKPSPLNTQAQPSHDQDLAMSGLSSPVNDLFSHMGGGPFNGYQAQPAPQSGVHSQGSEGRPGYKDSVYV